MKKKPAQKKTDAKVPAGRPPMLLPGLGGAPWGHQQPKPMTRMDVERFNRAIAKIMSEQEFETDEEMQAFLSSLLEGGNVDAIIDRFALDPEEEAQGLINEAMESDSPAEARLICRKALKLAPHCIDALVMQASLESRSEEDLVDHLTAIVRGAEERFGSEYMEEHRGHFWGFVETRPYMRARMLLAEELIELGDIASAAAELEGMLALNPSDNQGGRDILRGLYLELENLDGVRALNKAYDDSSWAIPAWSAVLERWMSGDSKEAARRARAAHKRNRHVVHYLLGEREIPLDRPEYFSTGDEREAILCVHLLGTAWYASEGAVAWLRGLNLK